MLTNYCLNAPQTKILNKDLTQGTLSTTKPQKYFFNHQGTQEHGAIFLQSNKVHKKKHTTFINCLFVSLIHLAVS
jgi:hypothetical protein